jgi:hypothetical protein
LLLHRKVPSLLWLGVINCPNRCLWSRQREENYPIWLIEKLRQGQLTCLWFPRE